MSPLEFFADHTYRMVFFGVSAIGMVAGALGVFAYLRKQSLISDVISHAALPGTLTAFLIAVTLLGVDGRNMLGLILGAIIAGILAVAATETIAQKSKLRIDTAMAITLAVFFGLGMLLSRIIANQPLPGKGGIEDYLFGNAAVLTYADLATSIVIGGLAIVIMVVFWKEFSVRTFDPDFSSVIGVRARAIDALMFGTIAVATVIGVKAVGLVLMVAFVVTPPAAARQWTSTLTGTVVLAGGFGAIASGVGAYLSISMGRIPTGPLIVVTLFAVLVVSLLFAPRRGILAKMIAASRTRKALVRG